MTQMGRSMRLSVRHRARVGAFAFVAAATGLTACSQISHVTSARAVGNSFTKLSSQSGVSLEFSVGLTPTQISQLASSHGGTGISTQMAQNISQTALVIEVQTGNGEAINSKTAAKDSANKIDFGVRVGSSMPIELRYVGQTLYARAQIGQLLTDFGQDPSKAASFQSSLQKADQYVAGLGALGQGQWVSISKASLQPILGILKQFGASQGQSASQNKTAVTKLFTDLKTAFKNNATYTNAGTHGGRTEYNIDVALQTFVQQALSSVQGYLSAIPGGLGSKVGGSLNQAATKVPAHATMQLFVKNNKAQEVDVDVNQFLAAKDQAPFAVPVRLVIGEPAAITAPSGATTLDLSKIGQLITGLLSGGLGASAGLTTPTT